MLSAEFIEIKGFDGEGNVGLVDKAMKDLYGKSLVMEGVGKADVAENFEEI
jgi:hypothetical protein